MAIFLKINHTIRYIFRTPQESINMEQQCHSEPNMKVVQDQLNRILASSVSFNWKEIQ